MEKAKKQAISLRVKSELGGRRRIDRPTFSDFICCRTGPFFSQIKQGHEKLNMRLDLAKFLEEQKFCKIALSGLLTPSQVLFCEKQAKQVVRSGDFKSDYSSDEEH